MPVVPSELASDLASRARILIRDQPRSFSEIFVVKPYPEVRYRLPAINIMQESTTVYLVDSATPRFLDPLTEFSVDEREGSLILTGDVNVLPIAGTQMKVQGYSYEWFLDSELAYHMEIAIDWFRKYDEAFDTQVESPVYAQMVTIWGLLQGLWALLAEVARDIDVADPEISIPASQRYGQIQGLIQFWEQEYGTKAELLNIGPTKIQMFTLRRVSRSTNRLVPVYRAREFDDSSATPTRIMLPIDSGEL